MQGPRQPTHLTLQDTLVVIAGGEAEKKSQAGGCHQVIHIAISRMDSTVT